MSIEAIVKRRRRTRKGKGFSREELREVDLSFSEALKRGIPIDTRRSTKHEENVKRLKDYAKAFRPEPSVGEKKVKTIDLTEVKGIGPKTAEKLKEAGIRNANELATSSPQIIAETFGSSEERATNLIRAAHLLLEES